jgi:signal transduction histidine kinase
MYMVVVFSLLAALSLALFGTLQITAEHNPHLGYLELLGAAAATLNLVGTWLTRNVRLGRNLLLLTILAFLAVMLLTGGTEGTGIFWFFVFPVSAFFLAGGKGGVRWLAGLFGATIFLVILSELDVVTIPYSLVVIRQMLVCLFVVTAGIYAYQQARERSEERVRLQQQELDQAMNEFLTLASHQLRTPISAISWFSEMLLHGDAGKLSAVQREHIAEIDESNKRSAAIVDAIIMVSNLQAGSLNVRLEPIDIPALCHEVLEEQLEKHRVVRKLEFIEKYQPHFKKVGCDAALIRVIMRNLISNAIKYTPNGGKIEIAASHDEKFVRIAVSDNGYGIPKNEQNKIFAKLFRASNIKIKDTDGTGLGLFIVKAILEQVGGQITFESEENEGSTFTVLLPAAGMTHKKVGLPAKASHV